ncbi:MAG: chromosome segregation protein SMC [Ignavibacteriales bacterium]|nr:MAG: chromosome segregation protein SMC [Ignavibacteriaceae bacterium]MBW7874285.1 chromosome segregation protein SMC [Ignavibacteria bacterium]MCZ2142671.1 chromosome segregation protein SMC [Ignavibacteriales bacterium]MBV6443769.1 Chromosome partition protein Smc [Ignavibacteriaceae bacterium]MBZ0196618.1 chromosome segregation protein SMC [Ignavibacteriaceae bacterium]
MYLSKLEIFGFKSFAQKTVIQFNKGITAIVGPNGCGKTNIVDALRWCIGEQKSSVLRSDKMENVVFNGTSMRKPLGMSEVSLTIENDRGVLPLDYSEVIITRRIFRSGESEYLLNKNIARLKDITGLFMDTGMGANAYSVIELKMVESILSNKAEERRTMFEEAAGVNKYKIRRRLTLRKLEEVRDDLNRANDLISEIEKKVTTLERQASKAEKYKELADKLTELDLSSAAIELFIMLEEQGLWQQKHLEAAADKHETDLKLKELDKEYAEIREQTFSTENELKEIRRKITAKTEVIYRSEQTISVAQESKRSLENNIKRFETELEEFKGLIEQAEESLEDLNFDLDEKSSEEAVLSDSIGGLSAVLEEKRERLNKAREDVRAFGESVLSRVQSAARRVNEFSNMEKGKERTEKEIEKSAEKENFLTEEIKRNNSFIEELSSEIEETSGNLKNAEQLFNETTLKEETLQAELNALKEKEFDKKSALNDLKTRIDFLTDLINNLEGFSLASKKLKEDNTWYKGEKQVVSALGEPAEEFRLALEAALKENFTSFIVPKIADVQAAVSLLLNSKSGKASFIVDLGNGKKKKSIAERIAGYAGKKALKQLKNEKGFIDFAYKLIKVPVKYQKYFEVMLQNVAVVKDLSAALKLAGKYSDFTFITADGDRVKGNGVVEAGSKLREEDSLFGRKAQLESLKLGIKPLEDELTAIKQSIYEKEYALHLIDLKDIREAIKIYQSDLLQLEKQLAQHQFEVKKATEEKDTLLKEREALSEQLKHFEEEIIALKNEIESDEKFKAETQATRSEFEANAAEAESEFGVVSKDYNLKNVELERVKGEKRNILNSIERTNQNILSTRSSIARREEDIKNAKNEIELLTGTIEDSTFDLDENKEAREALRLKEKEIEADYLVKRGELDELDRQKNALREERDKISDQLHLSDLKFNEYSINIRNLKERVTEKYDREIEPKEPSDEERQKLPEWRREVNKIEQQLHQMGPVNLLAFEEYDREKERFDFYAAQRDDLIRSEKDLIKTIEEINTTAQTLFFETFEAIRENFRKIFRSLFREEDEADLKLEDGVDPLEARIEIIAKPRGKRPTSIELLSGGEKTLTAIALLFAIYLVKPSPFCILDEIDAPLDDANIDRFTKILREFSANTQFIVVTHNKRTMEAADTMYGVTMQEEGVSKLVSVRFNKDFNIVA